MRHLIIVFGLALLVGGRASAAAPGDPTRGAELYDARCGACHSLEANRVGPAHRGVYGRKAGSAPPMSEQDIDDLIAFLNTLTDDYTPVTAQN